MCFDIVVLCSLPEVHETFFLRLIYITESKPSPQPILYIARSYTQKTGMYLRILESISFSPEVLWDSFKKSFLLFAFLTLPSLAGESLSPGGGFLSRQYCAIPLPE